MHHDILKMFCKQEEESPFFDPVTDGEYTYACNMSVIIKTKMETAREYKKTKYAISSLFEIAEQAAAANTEKLITWKSLLQALSQIPKVPVYAKCIYCEGSGGYDCEYCKKCNICPKCKGTGFDEKKQIDNAYADNYFIEIENAFFLPYWIDLLTMPCCDFTLIRSDNDKANLFISECADILIMPSFVNKDSVIIKL
jgi:hypothetical protein